MKHIQYLESRHMTPLNATFIEVFSTIKGKNFIQYPPPIMSPSYTRAFKKFCLFHKDKRYDIEDCFILKKKNLKG